MGSGPDTKVTPVPKELPPEQEYEKLLREGLTGGAQDLVGRLPEFMKRIMGYQDNMESMYARLPGYQDQGDALMKQLQAGQLPAGYVDNFSKAINENANNSLGSMVNRLGARGTIGSTGMNTGLRDISRQASNAFAQNYLNSAQFLAGTAYKPQEAAITAGKAYGDLSDSLYKGAAGGASLLAPGMSLYKLFNDLRIAQLPDTVVEQGGGK